VSVSRFVSLSTRQLYCAYLHNPQHSCPVLCSPADVASLEMHGTGTSLGDPIEVGALCEVFCGARSGVVILTVNRCINHDVGMVLSCVLHRLSASPHI